MDCEGSKLVAGSSVADQWTAWLAERRHGGDREQLRRVLKVLGSIRDDVIAHAAVASGDTVLDVGCGDGLIAFAAAEAVGPSGSVTFSDISRELLEHCRQLATAAGINGRCRFVSAAASDLTPIADQSGCGHGPVGTDLRGRQGSGVRRVLSRAAPGRSAVGL